MVVLMRETSGTPDVVISMSWLQDSEMWLMAARLDGKLVWTRCLRTRSTIEPEDVRILANALMVEFETWATLPW